MKKRWRMGDRFSWAIIAAKRFLESRYVAYIVAGMAFISVCVTYYVIVSQSAPLGSGPRGVSGLILLDVILLLILAAILAKRLFHVILQRRQNIEGSRLQTRVVKVFLFVAIVPTILMALFSAIFFHFGVQTWFDERVSTAVEGSVAIAKEYLEEHKENSRVDILRISNDLNFRYLDISRSPQEFGRILSLSAKVHKVPEALVFQFQGQRPVVVSQSDYSSALEFALEDLTQDQIQRAADGEVVIIAEEDGERVKALMRLKNFLDSYLIIGRFVDVDILNYTSQTEGAALQYRRLSANISRLQVTFFIIFVIVSLLLLLLVLWFGVIFAIDLVKPVGPMVRATERLKEGDFSVRVPEGPHNDEIGTLARSFNLMAAQLQQQKDQISVAQRKAAWSDVARRVAHEIKNPLTPIQLSAERALRKYKDEVSNKQEFERYLTTIVRNVGDIGAMVEEFARFARIPAPTFSPQDLKALVEEAIFSRGGNDIVFESDLPEEPIMFECDKGQLLQVLTNLYKNAEESIAERLLRVKTPAAVIKTRLFVDDKAITIMIEDNGTGVPKHMLSRLTEPYVTTKEKGTGVGLAIVEKMIEDHRGQLDFHNLALGAAVTITFKK